MVKNYITQLIVKTSSKSLAMSPTLCNCLQLFFLTHLSTGANFTDALIGEDLPDEVRLRLKLAKNYDPSARPVVSTTTLVNVTYKASVYQLVGFNTKDQTIKMLMFQRMEWVDELLQWDPEDYGGLNWIRYYRNSVWTPDILAYNDVGTFDMEKYDRSIPLTVYSSGLVVWTRPVDYETMCSLDVTNFPFDTQKCDIVIGSWQYFESEVNITCMPIDLSSYMEDSLWTLKGQMNCFICFSVNQVGLQLFDV